MDATFDPYDEWLGIPAAEQPAHFYRLLGLPIFAADSQQIRDEADRRMQHVRSFQLGKRSHASQAILNELSAARVCLLNAESKAHYDAALSEWLAARLPGPPPVPPEAPPLLPPETARLLPAEERDSVASQRRPSTALSTDSAASPQKNLYIGWIAIGIIVLFTLVVLAAQWFNRRPGALQHVTEQPPAVPLPGSDKTPDTNLGGKQVAVPSDVVLQMEQGDVNLHLARAQVTGPTLKLAGETTANWQSADDRLQWQFLIRKPGIFRVIVTYAAGAASKGEEASVAISGRSQPLTLAIRDTGGNAQFVSDELSPMVMLNKSGRYTLSIQAAQQPGGQLMTLKDVRLRRAPVR